MAPWGEFPWRHVPVTSRMGQREGHNQLQAAYRNKNDGDCLMSLSFLHIQVSFMLQLFIQITNAHLHSFIDNISSTRLVV